MADIETIFQSNVHFASDELAVLEERGISLEQVAETGLDTGRRDCLKDRNIYNYPGTICEMAKSVIEDTATIELACAYRGCPRESSPGGYAYNPVESAAKGLVKRVQDIRNKKRALDQAMSDFQAV